MRRMTSRSSLQATLVMLQRKGGHRTTRGAKGSGMNRSGFTVAALSAKKPASVSVQNTSRLVGTFTPFGTNTFILRVRFSHYHFCWSLRSWKVTSRSCACATLQRIHSRIVTVNLAFAELCRTVHSVCTKTFYRMTIWLSSGTYLWYLLVDKS
jgi:hypothetical protein